VKSVCGALAIWIKRSQPDVNVTGVDADPGILRIAGPQGL
jgi:hypothetical protein